MRIFIPYTNQNLPEYLSDEIQMEYFRRFQAGDESYREIIIAHNLRLVMTIAIQVYKKMFPNMKNIMGEELFSIGEIGLIKAVNKYTLDKNTKFSTFAGICILNEMRMAIRSDKKLLNFSSTDDILFEDNDGNCLTRLETLSTGKRVEDRLIRIEERKELHKALLHLDYIERLIIIKRYGFFNIKEMTQDEIAKQLGISQSYVSRLEKRAREHLADSIKNTTIFKKKEKKQISNKLLIYLARVIISDNINFVSLKKIYGVEIDQAEFLSRLEKKDRELYEKVKDVLFNNIISLSIPSTSEKEVALTEQGYQAEIPTYSSMDCSNTITLGYRNNQLPKNLKITSAYIIELLKIVFIQEQIKNIITSSENSMEKIILLLRLGYVKNKCFSEEQISMILNVDVNLVIQIVNDGLNHISQAYDTYKDADKRRCFNLPSNTI